MDMDSAILITTPSFIRIMDTPIIIPMLIIRLIPIITILITIIIMGILSLTIIMVEGQALQTTITARAEAAAFRIS